MNDGAAYDVTEDDVYSDSATNDVDTWISWLHSWHSWVIP